MKYKFSLLITFIITLFINSPFINSKSSGQCNRYIHHSASQLEHFVEKCIVKKCPEIASFQHIGFSADGRVIKSLQFKPLKSDQPISDYPKHFKHYPDVKFVSNIHGNEMIGRETTFHYAREMCEAFKNKHHPRHSLTSRHLSETSIHFIFDMNPDGYDQAYNQEKKRKNQGRTISQFYGRWNSVQNGVVGRQNGNRKDLNREFGDLTTIAFKKYRTVAENNTFVHHLDDGFACDETCNRNNPKKCFKTDFLKKCFDAPSSYDRIQPEVATVKHWSKLIEFVVSGGFHGGELCANYAFDHGQNKYTGSHSNDRIHSLLPLFDHFIASDIAFTYARSHSNPDHLEQPEVTRKSMWHHKSCDNRYWVSENVYYPAPVTNGAEWYSIAGSMQDWNYLATNCHELTVEMGCDKWIEEKEIKAEFLRNRPSFDKLIESAHKGVRGVVDVRNCDFCKRNGFDVFVEVQPVTEQFYKKVVVSDEIENFKNEKGKSRTKTVLVKNQDQVELVQNEITNYFDSEFQVKINTRKNVNVGDIVGQSDADSKFLNSHLPSKLVNAKRMKVPKYTKAEKWDFVQLLPSQLNHFKIKAVVVDKSNDEVKKSTDWYVFEFNSGEWSHEELVAMNRLNKALVFE